MKKINKEQKRRGGRYDGYPVKVDPFHSYMVHLMNNRADSEVFIRQKFDVTELLKFIERKNQEHPELKITIFHTVVTAIARTIKERPVLNRFISGRRYYQRDQISLSFVAKKQFTDYAEEALMILRPTDEYQLKDFSKKIIGEVHEARTGEDGYGADDILAKLQKLPIFAMRIFIGILKFMDYYGLVPKALTRVDPNYTTVLISNLGSIKCDAVYHHLCNFGTESIMITIGEVHKEQVIDTEGNIQVRDMMELGATIDERIGDGFYFARSLQIIKHLFENPELLELPLKEKLEYEC